MLNWQQWLEQNYKTISMWARRWHPEEWRELLAFLTIYLQKNWHKFSKIPDGDERIKFLQTWMKNNVKWKNSEFNKSIAVNDQFEDPKFNEEAWSGDVEIAAEDISEDVKEFIIDLDRRFDEEEVKRILMIRSVYLILKPHEKVLYDLYFTKMLSLRNIARQLSLPLSAVYGMVNDLKKKIKDECGM